MDNAPEIMNFLMTYVGALSALLTNVPAYSAPVIPLKAVLVSNNSSTTFVRRLNLLFISGSRDHLSIKIFVAPLSPFTTASLFLLKKKFRTCLTIINRMLPMNLLKAYFVDRTKEFIYMSRVEKFIRKVIRSLGNGKSKAFMLYFRHHFKIASMNMRLRQNGLFS